MKITNALTGFMGAAFLFAATANAEPHVTPTAPDEFLKMENAVEFDGLDANVAKTVQRNYKNKCSKCHGASGDGKGSAAADMILKPTAFNAPGFMESKSDGQLFWIIQKGSPGTEMKPFGVGSEANMSDEEIWQQVAYMRATFAK